MANSDLEGRNLFKYLLRLRMLHSYLNRTHCLPLLASRTLIASTRVGTERKEDHVEGGRGRRDDRGGGGGGEGAVLGPAAGPSARYERADQVVSVPRTHRRVHGHPHLPVREHRHRHRVQEPVLRRGVHRRRLTRRRLVLRRHHLRARLLHRRRLRWAHKPGGDVRAVRGAEAVAGARRAVHRGAVPGRHLRRGHREGDHDAALRLPRRRRQHGGRRLLPRRRARRRDCRHVHPRLHRLLRHRPQAHRPRLLHPRVGAAADWVRGVRGAPGHHTDHRHGHQPGEEPWRRRPLQPAQSMERSLDLLGWAADRGDGGGGVPQAGAARGGR